MSRMMRRVAIIFVFLSFNIFLIGGIYYVFIKAPETCTDGKQNQNESGIDCGGVCQVVCEEVVVGEDLQTKELVFVSAGNNNYDVLGRLYNPNDTIGATAFHFEFELKDGDGKVIATRSGENYILPQETKSLIGLNLTSSIVPQSVSLKISTIVWERLSGYRERPIINIYQKSYNQVTAGFGYSELFGLLSNESAYDFRSIVIKVVLRDASGKVLALNTHEMRSVGVHESRDFKLVWPLFFEGVVEKIDTEVDADVYHSENFLRQYFPGGKQ